ncbi:hypothetical protein EJ357_24290 [Streptomyces cyaneochromogenes]|uniref:SGNH hydrolase-type esterase domain-containing protein n=1 Tax=Streptomyces cyaneochromogenes TaxID=2496836 RepID=A0A3Q9EPS7_9ACTN|nr:hypothetical protein [Streptomyces cyaneochromogenes]AZQ36209.1 hypothetical protein EJ357_24290 [Streptomyces cyaneochromogenes]
MEEPLRRPRPRNGTPPAGLPFAVVALAVPAVIVAQRTVVLVTVHGPVTWKDRVNSAIRQTAEAHANVVVADWDRAVQGKDDLLANDGIHPGPTAAKLYAKTVAQALERK